MILICLHDCISLCIVGNLDWTGLEPNYTSWADFCWNWLLVESDDFGCFYWFCNVCIVSWSAYVLLETIEISLFSWWIELNYVGTTFDCHYFVLFCWVSCSPWSCLSVLELLLKHGIWISFATMWLLWVCFMRLRRMWYGYVRPLAHLIFWGDRTCHTLTSCIRLKLKLSFCCITRIRRCLFMFWSQCCYLSMRLNDSLHCIDVN